MKVHSRRIKLIVICSFRTYQTSQKITCTHEFFLFITIENVLWICIYYILSFVHSFFVCLKQREFSFKEQHKTSCHIHPTIIITFSSHFFIAKKMRKEEWTMINAFYYQLWNKRAHLNDRPTDQPIERPADQTTLFIQCIVRSDDRMIEWLKWMYVCMYVCECVLFISFVFLVIQQ